MFYINESNNATRTFTYIYSVKVTTKLKFIVSALRLFMGLLLLFVRDYAQRKIVYISSKGLDGGSSNAGRPFLCLRMCRLRSGNHNRSAC